VKLQKQLSRKVGNRKYPKYVVTIPPKHIKELGWQEGEELTSKVIDNKLVLEIPKQSDKE